MSDPLLQGLLPSSSLLYLPSSSTSSSLVDLGMASNNCMGMGFNQFSSYPLSGLKSEDLEVARYIRQLAECKLKELEFQKAQVQLLKESIPMYPGSSGLSSLNYLALANSGSSTTTTSSSSCLPAQEIKTLPATPIVPSPVLLSSYPSLSPFALNSISQSVSSPRLDSKPNTLIPGISEVISLFPARKSFICPEVGCGKALKTRLGLERHSRNHTGGRRFVCTVKGCNKKFLESNTLKRHVRIHTGEKPFLCPSEGCGRSFSDGSNYRRHLSTHSKEKPFKCPFADCKVKPFGFTRAATLRTHLLNFHNVKLCSY